VLSVCLELVPVAERSGPQGFRGTSAGRSLCDGCSVASDEVAVPWLKEAAPSQALQQTLIDLDTAYAAFFDGRKGYPHKKCRDDGDSFRLPQGFERNGQAVKLPKVGWVRCVITRPILGAVCNITISRDGEHWYVSFCAEESVPADTRREREAQIIAMEDEAGRREAVAGGPSGSTGVLNAHSLFPPAR